jgi:hypothetical protein
MQHWPPRVEVSLILKSACLVLAIASLAPTSAAADPADNFCSDDAIVAGAHPARLARVPKNSRLAMSVSLKPADLHGRYANGGDLLLIGPPVGSRVCALNLSRRLHPAGWVELPRLAIAPVDTLPPLSAWTGHWAETISMDASEAEIDLAKAGNGLKGSGDSSWDAPNGGPHDGGFSASAIPVSNQADFAETASSCKVHMVLAGAWLVVADNGGCGGDHAGLTGVYRRR